jgi:hypothetical protein
MNITLKPKYSNFIKMIDNYKNIDVVDKTIINNNVVSEELLNQELLVSTLSDSKLSDSKLSDSKLSDLELPDTKNVVQNDLINIADTNSSVIINKDTSNDNNSNNNSLKILCNDQTETREIFDKLHSLISKFKNRPLELTTVYNKNKDTDTDTYTDKQNIDEQIILDSANNKSNLEFSDSEKLIVKNIQMGLNKEKSKKRKNNKINKENLNEEEQKEKLESLYEKEIYNENSSKNKNNKKKQSKDELKKICKDFEEKCIMDSTRDFNVREDMYYINMDILKKNISNFNTKIPENYECCVLYRNYKDPKITLNPDKNIGWMEISKTGEKYMISKNKILSASLRLFEKTNKFRKTINDIKVRAFKLTFLVYKTNIKMDILALIKLLN